MRCIGQKANPAHFLRFGRRLHADPALPPNSTKKASPFWGPPLENWVWEGLQIQLYSKDLALIRLVGKVCITADSGQIPYFVCGISHATNALCL